MTVGAQASLGEYGEDPTPEPEGGDGEVTETPDIALTFDDQSLDRSCRHCGGHVSKRFARVYGDRDNRVHRCPQCVDVQADLKYVANGRERTHMQNAIDRVDHGRQR